MKIRVTIMTENEKHATNISKEELEATAAAGWQLILGLLGANGDKAVVEKAEVVEM